MGVKKEAEELKNEVIESRHWSVYGFHRFSKSLNKQVQIFVKTDRDNNPDHDTFYNLLVSADLALLFLRQNWKYSGKNMVKTEKLLMEIKDTLRKWQRWV